MTQARIGQEQNVLTVIFEFNIEPEQQRELGEKIQRLVGEIVSKQPGFVSAHLHLSTDGRKILNYFQWADQEAFDRFRQNEAAQQQIRSVISQYGPRPRAYDIVYSAAAGNSLPKDVHRAK